MSIINKLKPKQASNAIQKKILAEVKQEAFEEERRKIKLELKTKQEEYFIKEIEKAKKEGAEKARVGSISTIIKRSKQAKKIINQGIEVSKKGLDMIGEPTFYPKNTKKE